MFFDSGILPNVRLDGGACWIDNYMGIDDNNCILCFLKPVIMIRYSLYWELYMHWTCECEWRTFCLIICLQWNENKISWDMKSFILMTHITIVIDKICFYWFSVLSSWYNFESSLLMICKRYVPFIHIYKYINTSSLHLNSGWYRLPDC